MLKGTDDGRALLGLDRGDSAGNDIIAFVIGLIAGFAVLTGIGTLIAEDEYRLSLLLCSACASFNAVAMILSELFDKLSTLIKVTQEVKDKLGKLPKE